MDDSYLCLRDGLCTIQNYAQNVLALCEGLDECPVAQHAIIRNVEALLELSERLTPGPESSTSLESERTSHGLGLGRPETYSDGASGRREEPRAVRDVPNEEERRCQRAIEASYAARAKARTAFRRGRGKRRRR